jgi:hypothetical protein
MQIMVFFYSAFQRLVTLFHPFLAVTIQIPDVRIEELNEGLPGKQRSRQGVHLKGTHDLVIKTLAVETNLFQRAEGTVVFVIEAEDDLGRTALKSFPIPVRVCFSPKEVPDANPFFDNQFKRIFPLLMAADRLLQIEQSHH